MQIFVKQLSGSVSTLHVSPLDTIEWLKTSIPDFSRYAFSAPSTLRLTHLLPSLHDPRLTFAGRDLEDHLTLADSNIHNECTLSVGAGIRFHAPYLC